MLGRRENLKEHFESFGRAFDEKLDLYQKGIKDGKDQVHVNVEIKRASRVKKGLFILLSKSYLPCLYLPF